MMTIDSHADQSAGSRPKEPYYCPPRLGISHLLLWTAVVAVFLKLMAAGEMLLAETPVLVSQAAAVEISQTQIILLRVHYFLYCVIHAAAIVGISILLRDKIRGSRGRLQPGHWFVLIGGMAALVTLFMSLLFLAIWFATKEDGLPRRSGYPWISTVFLARTFLVMGIYLWATWASRGSKWWQSSFALLVIANLFRHLPEIPGLLWWLQSRIDLPFGWSPVLRMGWEVFSVAAMIVLLVAVVVDLIDRKHRDWLHWTGIAVIVSTNVVMSTIQWGIQQLL